MWVLCRLKHRSSPAGGAVVPDPPFEIGSPPFYVWPLFDVYIQCCILKMCPPSFWFLAPPAAKSWRRAYLNIVYFMGGELVFDWDRLENFLITRDRPVGNIVTNTKCRS